MTPTASCVKHRQESPLATRRFHSQASPIGHCVPRMPAPVPEQRHDWRTTYRRLLPVERLSERTNRQMDQRIREEQRRAGLAWGFAPSGADLSDLLHDVAPVDVIVDVIDSLRLRQRLRQRSRGHRRTRRSAPLPLQSAPIRAIRGHSSRARTAQILLRRARYPSRSRPLRRDVRSHERCCPWLSRAAAETGRNRREGANSSLT